MFDSDSVQKEEQKVSAIPPGDYDDYEEAVVVEGTEEVKPGPGPSGQSKDPDNAYFWKMSRDKRIIEVVIPVDDSVTTEQIIWRLGEDDPTTQRGPDIQVGYKYKDEFGSQKERLIINGTVLNRVMSLDSFWTLEEMGGVKIIDVSLLRPIMMRTRADPVKKRKVREERIESQTWDALLLEERLQPEVVQKAYVDIVLDGEKAGRMVFGLYGNDTPNSVQQFLDLCRGTYTDEEGNEKEAVHKLKGCTFDNVSDEFVLAMGSGDMELKYCKLTPEELKAFVIMTKDTKGFKRNIGPVESTYVLRWGGDIDLPYTEEGIQFEEGSVFKDQDDEQRSFMYEILDELVEKGEGARLCFLSPDLARGLNAKGEVWESENFKCNHIKRGIISFDRNEETDMQGSKVMLSLKEFPEMDGRWTVFGEIVEGMDVLDRIEREYDRNPKKVLIEDCGVLA